VLDTFAVLSGVGSSSSIHKVKISTIWRNGWQTIREEKKKDEKIVCKKFAKNLQKKYGSAKSKEEELSVPTLRYNPSYMGCEQK
jgi:hypothetical protein